ncbi:helix-turn-helix domain-containing protein [Vitiosangium sp. GDMCC 1.1324]|uniref:helix-turn-helix domain-containing protein n=1 Tax=Vitiosangium sp. (strain GDMCC 1.1324) TaxID=2138576 RepID=UPI000D3916B5|nr:helix-turn-helix domain-containing protein [Vitiosangium sp. GDMCC 1.1324]PTL79769.1 DNA-binding protein [Vitiosangium sp. GDMCC 1.1324]
MTMPTGEVTTGPEFLTVDEAAALLRVNRKTLYESIRRGEVPGAVHLGRSVRLRRSVLLSWTPGNSSPALGKKP